VSKETQMPTVNSSGSKSFQPETVRLSSGGHLYQRLIPRRPNILANNPCYRVQIYIDSMVGENSDQLLRITIKLVISVLR